MVATVDTCALPTAEGTTLFRTMGTSIRDGHLDWFSYLGEKGWLMCSAVFRGSETSESPITILDIPAVGGLRDEYWEVDMGNCSIRIHKPRDPLADLRAIANADGNRDNESSEDRAMRIRRIMSEKFLERSKRR